MKNITDMNWAEALELELSTLLDCVQMRRAVTGVTAIRLKGLIEEYERERQAAIETEISEAK